MEEQDVHFRHILLYYFHKGKNASQVQKKLYAVYGNEALKDRQCQYWFPRFRFGDFSLKNTQRSGRSVKVDEVYVKAIINSDCHSSTRDIITEKLNVSHTFIDKKINKNAGLCQEIRFMDPSRNLNWFKYINTLIISINKKNAKNINILFH